ncbi:MAG: trypsin-like peptidase domain-containing protein [Phycisphaerales bacterium]|nr:trypsin-like peptidase domain-containing protein [Phycisphaerales bacterium]
MLRRLCGLALAATCALPMTAAAQVDPIPSFRAPAAVDSGMVSNQIGDEFPIYSTEITVPGAQWLRLYFDEVLLSGTPGEDGSYLMIYSVEDGHWQRLDAVHVQNWNMTSAVFNGDTIYLELWAFADTGENRVVITEVEAGDPAPAESICDGADNRQLSYDQRVARMSTGCTAWLINHGNSANRFLTAGHCIGSGNTTAIMHFNVPLSTSGGGFRAPAPEYQYPVQAGSIQSINSGLGNDMALFQTHVNSNTGLAPRDAQGGAFNLANPPASANNQPVRVTGHGLRDPNNPQIPPEWSTAQKTHTGPLTSRSNTTLRYRPDTTGGNSGSPVILESTGNAIGIHSHGGCTNTGGANGGTARDHPSLVNMLANPLGTNIEQNPLGRSSTLFARNNGGSAGGAVYFDVDVSGVPLHIRGLEMNTSSALSTEFNVSVYITPNTSVGKETSASQWTLVGEGWGIAKGMNNPTRVILSQSFTLNANTSYGIAIVTDNIAHDYTNGTGSNEVYASAEMTITGNGATNIPFSGGVFSPRVFNGSLIYEAAGGAVVSNMFGNDATSTFMSGNNIKAMGFTVPQALTDHRLDRVVLRIDNATAGAVARARIYTDNNGGPGTLVTTLASPSLTSQRTNYSFLPGSAGVTLASGETYWLVVDNTGTGDFSWMANSPGIIPTGNGQHAGALFSTSAPTPPSSSDTSTFFNTYAVFATPVSPFGSQVTAPANNGSGGVFMTITAADRRLEIDSFETFVTGTGANAQVQVRVRNGGYDGFTGSSSGWSAAQTVSVQRQGTAELSTINLNSPIVIQPGQTRSIYIHSTTVGAGIRYTGTGLNPPQTEWSNQHLTLFSDAARIGEVPFGGTLFTPRTFAGVVNYTVTGLFGTGEPNNGSGGVFMNLRGKTQNITISRFDVAFTGTVGTGVDVEVWTRNGSYVGNDASSSGWTLTQTIRGTRQGIDTFSPLVLTDPIVIPHAQTRAVYLQAVTSGGGIRYNGTAANPPVTEWSDNQLELLSDVARTGETPFGGGRFMPRAFSGLIHYQPGGTIPTCPPDLNGDGVVDADDFFLFLSLFAAGDPRADFNNDGVIDADDFFAFLSAFAAGC